MGLRQPTRSNNRKERKVAIMSRASSFPSNSAKLYRSTSHPGHFIITPHKESLPKNTSLILHDTGRVICPKDVDNCPMRIIGVRLAREVFLNEAENVLEIPKFSKSMPRHDLHKSDLVELDQVILPVLNWIDHKIQSDDVMDIKTRFYSRKAISKHATI